MTPSQLTEGQWIIIDSPGKNGSIGFSVESGELSCFAINTGIGVWIEDKHEQYERGLHFSNDPAFADALFNTYKTNPTVTIKYSQPVG